MAGGRRVDCSRAEKEPFKDLNRRSLPLGRECFYEIVRTYKIWSNKQALLTQASSKLDHRLLRGGGAFAGGNALSVQAVAIDVSDPYSDH
jgi:hypothetical protein